MVSLLLVALAVGAHPAAAQKKVGSVCLTPANKVVVRSKCRSTDTKLSLGELSKRGATGNAGPAGSSGSSGRVVTRAVTANVTIPQTGVTLTQECPAGKTTLSGGCYAYPNTVFLSQSYPFDGSPNAWRCTFVPRGDSGTAFADLTIYAVCVNQ